MSSITNEVLQWSILLAGAFGLGCVVVAIIGGVWTRRRDRKRILAFMPSERAAASVADLAERRWRKQQQRFGKGGDDNAA